MECIIYPFRHADTILNRPEFIDQYNELMGIIRDVTEDDLIYRHKGYLESDMDKAPKSLSVAINEILKERFVAKGWQEESYIFQDNKYRGETWRLDFAKKDISLEVAFNHSTVIAWNLIKPVLASELNHVNKEIQTKIGVIITITNDLKKSGGFDSAVGTYEKFLDHLAPLQNLLTVPLLIIGLKAPKTFKIGMVQLEKRKKVGSIQFL